MNRTQYSEYRRPFYLPPRLPFHTRHLGRRIKHCMCRKSNFIRNITDHFIKKRVLDSISAHNNVQTLSIRTLKRRPVRGALLTAFTVSLNKHEKRSVEIMAWSNKIKMKVSPPFYSKFTRISRLQSQEKYFARGMISTYDKLIKRTTR
jgi:hypothetical protein